jgi:hypothetical protein
MLLPFLLFFVSALRQGTLCWASSLATARQARSLSVRYLQNLATALDSLGRYDEEKICWNYRMIPVIQLIGIS